ncbi:MAG TPA: FkbM family methyltransferase [Chitinophagaceae bacterium]|nr:FkbM family methyltransferase [Chitinophagaceae bacterium]
MKNYKNDLFLNRVKHFAYRWMPWLETVKAYCAKYDLFFIFHKGDAIGRDIAYKYGVYSEDFVNRFMTRHLGLKKGGLMLDVGANIGWYSVVMAKHAGLKIYSFEPDPHNFRCLTQNITNNNIEDVHPFQYAVADRETKMKLHLYKTYNTGRHSLIDHGKTGKYVEVDTVTIDGFMKKQGLTGQVVELFKIDIEGFEMAAFRGAKETLKNTRFIFSEFSPEIMESIHEDPANFTDLFENLGFQAYMIKDEDHVLKVDHQELRSYKEGVHNILWSKTSIG